MTNQIDLAEIANKAPRYFLSMSAYSNHIAAEERDKLVEEPVELVLGNGITVQVTMKFNRGGMPSVGYVTSPPYLEEALRGVPIQDMEGIGWVPSQIQDDYDL